MKMIKSEYDKAIKNKSRFVLLIFDVIFLVTTVAAVWIFHEKLHWGWLPAIFIGVLTGLAVMEIISRIFTSPGTYFTRKRNKG